MNYERLAAGFMLFVGLLATWQARKLALGELRSPGPGFFPFWLAVGLTFFSLALLVQSLRPASSSQEAGDRSFWKSGRGKLVAGAFLSLFGYAFLLESLGFLLATFLLMFFLFRVIEPRRWLTAILGSLATSVLAYALFRSLGVRLPAGLWIQ